MLPSKVTNHDVKLRHRNTVTAKATLDEVNPDPDVGQQYSDKDRHLIATEKKSQGEFIEDLCRSKQCLVNNDERHMDHRSKTLSSESSDDSLSEKTTLISSGCSEYEKKACSTNTMRANDAKHQTSSQSQNNSATGSAISCNSARILNTLVEIAIRVLLFYGIAKLERTTPFQRVIHPEEIWLYKNPKTKDYVPPLTAIIWIIFAPMILIIVSFVMSRDRRDFSQAVHAFTLGLALNGFVTSLLKVSVGRPRPDFFYRCFPDGVMGESFDHCTGELRVVNEGRKSFPSGHSSMSFAGFGFMSFYLASKLHIFNDRGRGQSWRLCLTLVPLFVALEVAVSRTCDYHHHWEDVLVGSVLGICVSYLCYRQYFPSIFAHNCHRAYQQRGRLAATYINHNVVGVSNAAADDTDENQPLMSSDRDNKWI